MQNTSAKPKRNLKPRERIVIAAPVYSLRMLEQTTGIPYRRWSEELQRHPAIPRSKLGKDTLLTVPALDRLIEALQVAGASAVEIERPNVDGVEFNSVDDVLRLVGRRAL